MIIRVSVTLPAVFFALCQLFLTEAQNTREPKGEGNHIRLDHMFINGTSIPNAWKWPHIEELHPFKGPLLHSAKWVHGVDFEGKTVGVRTEGTSVHIVPQLQKIAKSKCI